MNVHEGKGLLVQPLFAGDRMLRMVAAVGIALILCAMAWGGAEPPQKWRTSHFVENTFREGASSDVPTVYHREGFLPFVSSAEKPVADDPLPQGAGAVVIFCYIQSTGGRTKTQSEGYPLPDTAVQVSDGKIKVVLRTDGNGYVVASLPAGQYEIAVRGMIRKIVVKERQTLLVPIRAGKRMVN